VVIDVNHEACESLGYTRDELIGMKPPQFDAAPDLPALLEVTRRIEAGEVVTFETRHRRKDGTTFPVEVRGRQVPKRRPPEGHLLLARHHPAQAGRGRA
jgi:PAS domain S-box-containing protein